MKKLISALLVILTVSALEVNAFALTFSIDNPITNPSGSLYGDVNLDGKTNNKDLTLAFRYLNGINVSVDLEALDTNRDGSVDNKDVSILARYLAGQTITLADEPGRITNSYIDESYFKDTNQTQWYIKGWFGANYEVSKIGYSLDGGSTVYSGVTYEKDTALDSASFGKHSYRFYATLPVDQSAAVGEHNAMIVVKLTNGSVLNALVNAGGEYYATVTKEGAINSYVDNNVTADDKLLTFTGWFGATSKVKSFGYSVDGGAVNYSGISKAALDENNADDQLILAWAGGYATRFSASIDISALTAGSHTLGIYAKLNNGASTVVYALVNAGGEYNVPFTRKASLPAAKVTNSLIDESYFTDADQTQWYIKGWFGANYEVSKIGYSLDGGSTVYSGVTYEKDTTLNSASLAEHSYRFYATVPVAQTAAVGGHTVMIVVKLTNGSTLNALVNADGEYYATVTKEGAINSYVDTNVAADDKLLTFTGWFGATSAVKSFGYSVDGGSVTYSGISKVSLDENNADDQLILAWAGGYATRFSASIDISALTVGSHTLRIYAKLNNGSNTVVYALVNADGEYSVQFTRQNTPEPGKITNSLIDESYFSDTDQTVWYIKGWFGANYEVSKIGYSLDGGSNVYSSVTYEKDASLDEASYSSNSYRFTANIPLPASASTGKHKAKIIVKLKDGSVLNALVNADGEYNATIKKAAIVNSLVDEPITATSSKLTFTGWFGATVPVKSFGYSIDGGTVTYSGVTKIALDSSKAEDAAVIGAAGSNACRFKVSVNISSLSAGAHTATVYAKLDNGNTVVCALTNSGGRYSVPFTKQAAQSSTTDAKATNSLIDVSKFTDSKQYVWFIQGWYGANYDTVSLGYSLDGADPVFKNVSKQRESDLDPHTYSEYSYRFFAAINVSTLAKGTHTVVIYAKLNDGNNTVIPVLVNADGAYSVSISKTKAKASSAQYTEAASCANSYIDESKYVSSTGKAYIKGWYGLNYATMDIGYSINGGNAVFDGSVTYTKDSELDPHTTTSNSYRFVANIDLSNYPDGTYTIKIIARAVNGKKVNVLHDASGDYTVSIKKSAASTTPSTPTGQAAALIAQAKSWYGCKESDGSHKKIIDVYNNHSPLPNGYKVQYTDAWCATFVSACAIKTGLTGIVYKECGAHRQMQLFQNAGRFKSRASGYTPLVGDIIFYDWDGGGWCDHVGIVTAVSGTTLTVIEGNKSDAVGYRTISTSSTSIYGYGIPAYTSR